MNILQLQSVKRRKGLFRQSLLKASLLYNMLFFYIRDVPFCMFIRSPYAVVMWY